MVGVSGWETRVSGLRQKFYSMCFVCVAIGKVASVIGEGAGNRINRHRDGNHSQTESEST